MPHHRLSYNTSPCLLWWAHSLPPDRSVAVGRSDGRDGQRAGRGRAVGRALYLDTSTQEKKTEEREGERERRQTVSTMSIEPVFNRPQAAAVPLSRNQR